MRHSEMPYTDQASFLYTIASMYFHCKESNNHLKEAWKMPSLDIWSDSRVDASNNQTKVKETSKIGCSNPIDFHSKFTAFTEDVRHAHLDLAKDDLTNKFEVISDTAIMMKSVCAIYVRYTGWIPRKCDCTGKQRLGDAQQPHQQRHRRLLQIPRLAEYNVSKA